MNNAPKTILTDLFYDKIASEDTIKPDVNKGLCRGETNNKKNDNLEQKKTHLRQINPSLLQNIELAEYERKNDELRSNSEFRKCEKERHKRRYVSPDFNRRIFAGCVAERLYRLLKKVADKQPRLSINIDTSHYIYNIEIRHFLDENMYECYLANQLLPPIFKYTDNLLKYPRGILWNYVLVTMLPQFQEDKALMVNNEITTFKAEILKYLSLKFVNKGSILPSIDIPIIEGCEREARFLFKFIKLAINSIWLCAINHITNSKMTVIRFDSASSNIYTDNSFNHLVKISHSILFYDHRTNYWLYKPFNNTQCYYDDLKVVLADICKRSIDQPIENTQTIKGGV